MKFQEMVSQSIKANRIVVESKSDNDEDYYINLFSVYKGKGVIDKDVGKKLEKDGLISNNKLTKKGNDMVSSALFKKKIKEIGS